MSYKKLVFISHITEESDLAKIISEEIKSSFLGLLDTFVSSDGESLPAGGRWLDKIDKALTNSAIQISLCSPQSIKRPWINFEAGASWIRKIPVIPLCHSGISKSELPVPLSMLQAVDIDSEYDLKTVFTELTKVLGAERTPNVDYTKIIGRSNIFVKKYTYYNKIKEAIYLACNTENKLESFFYSGKSQSIPLFVADYIFVRLAPALDVLKDLGLVNYTFNGTTMTAEGVFKKVNITLTKKYSDDVLPNLK